MGPVINARARQSILRYIEIGKKEGRLITSGREAHARVLCSADGHCGRGAHGAHRQEEIFAGTAVIRAANFDEAIAIANNTEYG